MGPVAYEGVHLGCTDEYSEELNRIPIDGLGSGYRDTEMQRYGDAALAHAIPRLRSG